MSIDLLDPNSARASLCGDGRIGIGHGITFLNPTMTKDVSSPARMETLYPRQGKTPGELPGYKQLLIHAGDDAASLDAVLKKGPSQSTVLRYLQFDLGADTVVYVPPGDLAKTLGFDELSAIAGVLQVPVRTFNPEIGGRDPNRVWPLHDGVLAGVGQSADSFLVLPENQRGSEFLGRPELVDLVTRTAGQGGVPATLSTVFQQLRYHGTTATFGPPAAVVASVYADTMRLFDGAEPLGAEDVARIEAELGRKAISLDGNIDLAQRLRVMPAGRQALLIADDRVFVVDHGPIGPVPLDLTSGTEATLPAAPEDLRLLPLDAASGLDQQIQDLLSTRPSSAQQYPPRLLGGVRKVEAETRSAVYEIGPAFSATWRDPVISAAGQTGAPLITVNSPSGKPLSTGAVGQLAGLLVQLVTQKQKPIVVTNAALNPDLTRVVDTYNVRMVRVTQSGIADLDWRFRPPRGKDEKSLGTTLTPAGLRTVDSADTPQTGTTAAPQLSQWLTMEPSLRSQFFFEHRAALTSPASMEVLTGFLGAIDDLPGRVTRTTTASEPEVAALEAAGLTQSSLTALKLAANEEISADVMAVMAEPRGPGSMSKILGLIGKVPKADLIALTAGYGQAQAVVEAMDTLRQLRETDPGNALKRAAGEIAALTPWFRRDNEAADPGAWVRALGAEAQRLSANTEDQFWNDGLTEIAQAIMRCE
ncbi:hypothetical protein J2S43_004711 [Catenuloplanes nepalensis]|uniref:Uncharacterized protein n=1 Tax=Catenuloplanes nepalensis TaxID=587533 RepID=A0ABT9MXN1_9ACTN|nr:hypothetical protein [Catenuloplanes nepalensis]MDP9796199.1 hypothetical protein [Catenuloplanes nepalensis]